MKTIKSLRKDKKGFTGLEAAIVLTAFVVVAAVFSYVVLNAGFFSSEKAKEVVHTGVEQVTSSFELAGNVIGYGLQYTGTTYYPPVVDDTNLTVVELYLTLTAGQSPIDLDKLTVSYTDRDTHVGALNYTKIYYTDYVGGYPNETNNANVTRINMSMGNWTYYTADTPGATHNNLLEPQEKAIILITLPEYGVTANKPFTLELKPYTGAVIAIPRTAPGQIDKTMTLY